MRVLSMCLLLASCAPQALAAQTFPERGRAAVVDAAGVIPDDHERALNARIVAWDRATGHQLVVATVPSLEGRSIADYGVQLGRRWGLGHKGSAFASDGVILLLAPNERKVRIEVGYGLEPVLTDAWSSDTIRASIVPRLKSGDITGGLSAGADAIMAKASEAETVHAAPPHGSGAWWWVTGTLTMLVGGGWLLLRRARRKTAREVAREAAARAAARPAHAPTPPVEWPSRPVTPTPPRLTRTVGPESGPSYARTAYAAPSPPPPPPPPPSPSYDYGSSSGSSWGSGSSSSNDSGSSWGSSDSSSGFDSGGGSFGGGGSDSSY